MLQLSAPLCETLHAVARAMERAAHPWWIVSSAAVALHGGDAGTIGDVDVLFDARDVAALRGALAPEIPSLAPDPLFASRTFLRWHGAPLPVELFAGFALNEGGIWHEIVPHSREFVDLAGVPLPVPSRPELHALLLRFGRPKDLARAAALSASGPFPSRSGSA